MNSNKMARDSRKASRNKLQEDFNSISTDKSRKPRKTRCAVVENCPSCLNTASWRNKARIFEFHLCSTDPCSLWATMFHGQRVLSARPKPCCRLAVLQFCISSKIFLKTPQKSNAGVSGSNMEAGKLWSATASAHCTKPAQAPVTRPSAKLGCADEAH